MLHVECRGSHLAMGRQQGEQAREIIGRTLHVLRTAEAFRLRKPALLPMSAFLWLARRKALGLVQPDVERHYPSQARRLEGIAAGGRIDLGWLYLGLSAELLMAKVSYSLGACSAVGLVPPASVEPMIVKNFDYPELFHPLAITRHNVPDTGYESLDVSVGPMAGNHDGINEHGLSVCYNYGYGLGTADANCPITLLVQDLLENCRTTEDAVARVRAAKWAGGALLLIGDADGDFRAVELAPGMMAVRLPENGVLINTNHYRTPQLEPHDTPHNAWYTQDAVTPLRGQRVHESSEKRLARLIELTREAGDWTRNHLESVARDHAGTSEGSNHSPCRHADYFTTTSSVLFLPQHKRMFVVDGAPCKRDYSELLFRDPKRASAALPAIRM